MSSAGFHLDEIYLGFQASTSTVKEEKNVRQPGSINQASLGAAKLFMAYLENQAVISRPASPPSAIERWSILRDFRTWMQQHRGIAETTLDLYQAGIVDFLEAVGDDPIAYTAEAVRAFVLRRAEPHGRSRARCIANSVRAFLRFLAATGQCPAGREHAIPGFANWQLTSIPKFLVAEDIERAIAACHGESRIRDKAIILLLARLGLRASEVVNLKFNDIDWKSGRIAVYGKTKREEWLPLTQEVGDAILAYIERDRPPLAHPRLFVTDIAPLRPLSRVAVKCIVRRTLIRAGIKSTSQGAHVLRHSAATAMLRHGATLTGVGSVLRHRSTRMTMHYAKVDFDLLSEITQPWPGELPC